MAGAPWEAQAEAKLTDAVSGQLLGEWVDKRVGGGSIKTAAQWQWRRRERHEGMGCRGRHGALLVDLRRREAELSRSVSDTDAGWATSHSARCVSPQQVIDKRRATLR